jgi:hypothetical protein
MRTLGPREYERGNSWSGREIWLYLDVQALAVQVDTRPPLVSSVPVSPEQRSRSHLQGMEQDAHLTRFGRCTAVPLTVFT